MVKDLVLFLGNSIFKDDQIGLIVGERLRDILIKDGYEVEIVEKTGLALMDYLEGRNRVIIVDSIMTSKANTGEVIEVDLEEVKYCSIFSPHYFGINEAVKTMELLELNPPKELKIIGIEVKDVYTISEDITDELKEKLEDIVERVYRKIRSENLKVKT
ncbi:MAG: hydrogenase maturation protease [Archaeoglobaceae archaeon]|nr:hydrogenase maturation protease [Archaeoglobaceae archaeon]MDW7990214.1 hydrogenase maturation protease [Archaeoglobaceae archaeon]